MDLGALLKVRSEELEISLKAPTEVNDISKSLQNTIKADITTKKERLSIVLDSISHKLNKYSQEI
jgi:hypothetical protein